MKFFFTALLLVLSFSSFCQPDKARQTIKIKSSEVEKKVIAWRRDIHEHPELGNREFRTAELIAKHLQSLGFVKRR
jgi:amidohydrolase